MFKEPLFFLLISDRHGGAKQFQLAASNATDWRIAIHNVSKNLESVSGIFHLKNKTRLEFLYLLRETVCKHFDRYFFSEFWEKIGHQAAGFPLVKKQATNECRSLVGVERAFPLRMK